MRVVPFNEDVASKQYKEFYNQKGGGPIPVFRGPSYQKGYGIGSIIGGLFKSVLPVLKSTALPMLKSGAKRLGKTALKTGFNILSEGLDGKNVKQSAIRNLTQAGSDLINNTLTNSTNQRKRKRAPTKSKKNKSKRTSYTTIRQNNSVKGRAPRDIFN